jgi:hypothetical protein
MHCCLPLALCLMFASLVAAEDKPATELGSYARIELTGKLVEFKRDFLRLTELTEHEGKLVERRCDGWYCDLGPDGFYVYGPGDRGHSLRGSKVPTWELEFGDDKKLQEVARKLRGKQVKVGGDVRTELICPGMSDRFRIIIRVSSLAEAEV